MSEEKVLTKEIVEQRPAIPNQILHFTDYTSIEDAAADLLGTDKYHGTGINLSGLKQLTDTAAAGLSKHRGPLFLNGISELSDEAAKSLSEFNGALFLDNLLELSDEAAKSLSNTGGALHFGNLSEFSDVAARILAGRSNTHFSEATSRRVKNSMVITKEVALEHVNSSFIYLNEYGRIDDDAAAVFGGRECDGASLHFDGLSEISDLAAEHLSKHKGQLHLNGLTNISDAAAESLSNHQAEEFDDIGLCLDGLTSLSDAAAKSLGAHGSYLSLMGLNEQLSDSAAAHLAQHQLSDSAAASHLAQYDHLEIEIGEWTNSANNSFSNAIAAKSDGCLSSIVVIIGLLWGIYELTP